MSQSREVETERGRDSEAEGRFSRSGEYFAERLKLLQEATQGSAKASEGSSICCENVHSDLIGPFPNPSMCKAKYVLTFIDDCMRYILLYFYKLKFEVFEHLKILKAHAEGQFGKMIKIICKGRRRFQFQRSGRGSRGLEKCFPCQQQAGRLDLQKF